MTAQHGANVPFATPNTSDLSPLNIVQTRPDLEENSKGPLLASVSALIVGKLGNESKGPLLPRVAAFAYLAHA
ncbi:hypothetical protein GCM10023192_70960 [Amycolatopsis samaneae]